MRTAERAIGGSYLYRASRRPVVRAHDHVCCGFVNAMPYGYELLVDASRMDTSFLWMGDGND